jgi:ABC-type multidrug transport system fused ATPase/permease subunit
MGSAKMIECPFSSLGCPLGNLEFPLQGVVFGMLLLIFAAALGSYYWFGQLMIRSDNNRKWNRVARVASQPRYDRVNNLVLEHDQHVVVHATGEILEAMAARERAVGSARWHDVVDSSSLMAATRYSSDLAAPMDAALAFSPHSSVVMVHSPAGVNPTGAGGHGPAYSYGHFYGYNASRTPAPAYGPHTPAGGSANGAGSVEHDSTGAPIGAAAAGAEADANSAMMGATASTGADAGGVRNSATGPHLSLQPPAGTGEYILSSPHRRAVQTPGGARTRRLTVQGGKKGKLAKEGSRLLGKLKATMAHFDYQEVEVPLTVAFTHMYLKLKATDTVILADICLSIKPFHVTAIMGPSGAGKTSLLSLLRGQAHYADISGSLTVNGHAVESLERFRKRTAYVPQEDIVSEELSVEENIVYSALLFNRRGFLSAAECMPMVLQAEKLLDIYHVRTQVVGSSEKRGISGGQRKRVSIGMFRACFLPVRLCSGPKPCLYSL